MAESRFLALRSELWSVRIAVKTGLRDCVSIAVQQWTKFKKKARLKMGAAAYQRGTKSNRRQIAQDIQQSPESKTVSALRNEIDILNRRIAELEAQVKEQVAEIKALNDQGTELDEENWKLYARANRGWNEATEWHRAFIQKDRAHRKLSVIVRNGLTADEYHYQREQAARLYPSLFGDGS